VVVMMENRSFDHFLGWLPRARGLQAGLSYRDLAGHAHPTHDLGTDFTGAGPGITDPDHSWAGGLIQLDHGRCDGWLRTPSSRQLTDTYPIGYYTEASVPVLGSLARHYATLDGYFASIMAETFPNRLYMHAAQTDRDHNLNPPGFGPPPFKLATMPTIWDRVAAAGLSGRYYFSDLPFIGLWGAKYFPITAPVAPGVPPVPGGLVKTFVDDAHDGTLPNVSFLDAKFTNVGTPESDQHPFADIRVGEAFLSFVYRTLRNSPQWRRTVLVINYDEWGGFFDHVRPSKVEDDTDPAAVDHQCDGGSVCSEPPGTHPDYRQLGFRVPCIVVSPFASHEVIHGGPFEHTSILRMIEWRWGLEPLTARDANAKNLIEALDFEHENDTPERAIPIAHV
jgi:phospholipase C